MCNSITPLFIFIHLTQNPMFLLTDLIAAQPPVIDDVAIKAYFEQLYDFEGEMIMSKAQYESVWSVCGAMYRQERPPVNHTTYYMCRLGMKWNDQQRKMRRLVDQSKCAIVPRDHQLSAKGSQITAINRDLCTTSDQQSMSALPIERPTQVGLYAKF